MSLKCSSTAPKGAFPVVLSAVFCALVAIFAPLSAAADKQEGYYYPPVTSEEEFDRQLIDGPEPNKAAREAFVTLITRAQIQAPSHPQFSLFAKGSSSRRLIMVGLEDGPFDTLFRARADLAQLTAHLRGTPFFVESGFGAEATFFDLLQLLDYESLTVTDGKTWSHRIYFK